MKVPFVDLKAQYLSIKDSIDSAIQDVIDETAFIGGARVKAFEKDFAQLYGVKHCISVANGTDAIYCALKMLGVGQGDEVITTAHSWISTSETISQTGAKPIFIDVEENYFSINPELIEEKITKKTKAIIPVHIYGQACDMIRIMDIAKRHNLYVIEDTAQAHFSEFNNKRVGLFGNAATFSFYPGKNLGAYGDAGAIITNDKELAEKMRMFSNHGALVKHEHHMEGINSRLDGLQAAILSVKLEHILKWTDLRSEKARRYTELLSDISAIDLPKVRKNSKHSFHLYVIKTKRRDELKSFLNQRGIGCAIHYPTILPLLPAYNYLNYSKESFPVSYANQQEILSLPLYPELSEEQIILVTGAVRDFFSE